MQKILFYAMNTNFSIIDILNVIKFSKKNMSDTVIYYIFPRQFGLKNAFTSKEVLSFNGLYYIYMDREKELKVKLSIVIMVY